MTGLMTSIRWSRVLLGGLFIEMTMLAILLPLNAVSERAAYYSVPVLVLLTAFLFGWWAAAYVTGRFVLHGVLTALTASVIYIALTTASGTSVPLLFHLSHGLRILGGAAGGRMAQRRRIAPSLSP